jgi:hypothetical protein
VRAGEGLFVLPAPLKLPRPQNCITTASASQLDDQAVDYRLETTPVLTRHKTRIEFDFLDLLPKPLLNSRLIHKFALVSFHALYVRTPLDRNEFPVSVR